jgi:hypothetical protein
MATSLKQMAACIGLPASISVLHDFYGFWKGVLPTVTGGSAILSLKQQFAFLKGPHIHINIIHVGTIDSDDDATIDAAVHVCRAVYATVGLGVGRVRRFVILADDADGLDVIDSESEKKILFGKFTFGGVGIDVFMVRDITFDDVVGSAGYIPDDCGDTPDWGEDGVIVDVNRTATEVGRTFTHELGHFLGLSHTCGEAPNCTPPCQKNNLMTQSGCVDATAVNLGTALNLTSDQGDKMRCHFMIQPGC